MNGLLYLTSQDFRNGIAFGSFPGFARLSSWKENDANDNKL
jgi:hypothetical protein